MYKNKKTKLFFLALVTILTINTLSVFASEHDERIFQIDPKVYMRKHVPFENTAEIDYSNYYVNWDEILIKAIEESNLHIDNTGSKDKTEYMETRHFNLTPHSHHAHYTGSTYWGHLIAVTDWGENNYMPNPPFPSVEYYTGQSFVKSASWSTGVGATDSVISATLGFNVTMSSTVTAATTYTYPIPYMKKLRIVCQSSFYKYAYDCETKWMVFVHPVWVYSYSDWAYDRSADGPLFNSSYTVQVEDI